MSRINVRKMEVADLPAAGALAGRLVRMHHAYNAKRFLLLGDPERGYERWFGTRLEAPDAILLVADDDQGVVGYLYACTEPRSYNELLDACVKLHDIYVDERARKRGVGEALVREMFHQASAKGAPRVVLLAAAQNEAGQRLFERLGFRTTMVEMTCELNP